MAEGKNYAGWSEEELALIYDGECPVCTACSRSVETDPADAKGVRRIASTRSCS